MNTAESNMRGYRYRTVFMLAHSIFGIGAAMHAPLRRCLRGARGGCPIPAADPASARRMLAESCGATTTSAPLA